MPRRALAVAITAVIAGTLVMAVIASIFIHHLTAVRGSQAEALCPTLTVQSATEGVQGIVQAAIRADQDYPLYAYDGVSEIPRPVGTLGKGEQFCFHPDDLAIDTGVTTPSGGTVPIGVIETANWPKGVYSPAVNTIPTVARDDGNHRVVLTRWPTPFRLDGGEPLDFMYSPALGEETDVIAPLSANEVSSLVR